MRRIFTETMTKYPEHFLFRHWKERSEYLKSENVAIRKSVEKTICLDSLSELMNYTDELKDEYNSLGIPNEIIDSLKMDFENIAYEYLPKRLLLGKRVNPMHENLKQNDESAISIDGDDKKDQTDSKTENDLSIKNPCKAIKRFRDVLDDMNDFMPTSIIIKKSLERRLEVNKKHVKKSVKETYEKYLHYFKCIIEEFKESFIINDKLLTLNRIKASIE